MATFISIADYVIIVATLIASTGIGVYFRFSGGQQKTTLEYLLADKKMSILPVCFSVVATTLSAVAFVGSPVEAYMYGPQMIMRHVGMAIGTYMVAYFLLPVYFDMNLNSVFEYIEGRFGKTIKSAISVLYGVQMILYVPVVIYAPSLALSTLTGVPVWTAMVSMTAVCTFYSTLGGLKGVLWTDVFQSFLMIFTVVALLTKTPLDSGGIYKILQKAKEGQRLELFNISTDLTVRYTFWNTIMAGTVIGLFVNGTNFHAIQRLISNGEFKKAKQSLLWSIPITSAIWISLTIIGITMYSYYEDCDPVLNKEIQSSDQLVPLLIMKLYGKFPGLPGLCIAGVFSASLSTMSSILNALAFVTLEDYIKPFMRNSIKESTATFILKILALFYGAFCLCLSFVMANIKGIAEVATIVQGMVGAPTLGVVCLGMFTTTANEFGSATGLIAGFIINAWIAFGSMYKNPKYPSLPRSTAACQANDTLLYTVYAENTTLAMISSSYTTASSINENLKKYVFPLYTISFLWFPVISFLGTLIAGYAASYLIGFWKSQEKFDPRYLSPVVRKWLSKSRIPKEDEFEVNVEPTILCEELNILKEKLTA